MKLKQLRVINAKDKTKTIKFEVLKQSIKNLDALNAVPM